MGDLAKVWAIFLFGWGQFASLESLRFGSPAHGQDQLLLERAKHMADLVCDDTIHPDLSPWGLS